MYHSITINGKNTYTDYGLVPVSRPVVNPPGPDYTFLEIPGMSGSLDMSESLTGNIPYRNRTGSWEFHVEKRTDWQTLYSTLLTDLHGQSVSCVLEDDPDYSYEGRISVNEWKSEKFNSRVVLEYSFFPFKLTEEVTHKLTCKTENANQGVSISAAAPYISLTAVSEADSGMISYLHGSASNPDYVLPLAKGENILPPLSLPDKKTTLIYFKGEGTVTIKTRRGFL